MIKCRITGDSNEIGWVLAKMLRVDFDYNSFLDHVRGNEKLYRLAVKHLGLRPTRHLSIYDALIDAVVKQMINLKMAIRITANLIEAYGAHRVVDGLDYYWYPPADMLKDADIMELRNLKLSRTKARSLREIALAEYEGRLPKLGEIIADPWSTIGELTSIYGVGKWTAELAIAMVLDDFRLGPQTDLAVRRGLESLGIRDVDSLMYSGLIMYLASLEYESSK